MVFPLLASGRSRWGANLRGWQSLPLPQGSRPKSGHSGGSAASACWGLRIEGRCNLRLSAATSNSAATHGGRRTTKRIVTIVRKYPEKGCPSLNICLPGTAGRPAIVVKVLHTTTYGTLSHHPRGKYLERTPPRSDFRSQPRDGSNGAPLQSVKPPRADHPKFPKRVILRFATPLVLPPCRPRATPFCESNVRKVPNLLGTTGQKAHVHWNLL